MKIPNYKPLIKGRNGVYVAAALIGVMSIAIFPSILTLNLAGGFATLSVSDVNYDSNDPSIGGRAWLITVSQNAQGQSITGTIAKSQLVDNQDNVEAQNDVNININLDEMSSSYPIQSTSENIYSVEYKDINRAFDSCGSDYPHFEDYGLYGRYCYKYTKTANYGLVGTPSTNFKSTIQISSDGKTETATIDSLTSTTVNLGQGGSASWVGSLTTGEQAPIASDQRISAAYTSSWKTIDTMKYESYKTYAESGFLTCLRATDNKITCFNNFNTYSDQALEGKALTSQGGSQATVYGSQSSGQVKLELEKAIQFPVITLRLRADWIGTVSINNPVGVPKIESVSSEEFQTGSNGFITVNSKNIGDAAGSFAISVNCGSSFSVQGTTVNVRTLQPQETATSFVTISADVNSKTSETCIVKLYDRNNPSKSDERTLIVSANPILLCNPGNKRINGNTIEQCNINGSGWDLIETCGQNEKPERQANDNIICVKLDIKPEFSLGWSLDWLFPNFGGMIDNLTLIVTILSLGVVSIVIIMVVKKK